MTDLSKYFVVLILTFSLYAKDWKPEELPHLSDYVKPLDVVIPMKEKRNCSVSVFPIHIQPGNQCHFGDVAVGFDRTGND